MIKSNIWLLGLMLLIGCTTITPSVTPSGIVYTTQMIADEVGAGNYDALCTWIHTHLRYREDRTKADEWKDPPVTLQDRAGDCEDLALVALDVLKLWDVKDAFLLGVAPVSRNGGHVVCFFRDTPLSNWRYFSNDDPSLRDGGKKLPDLIRSVGTMMRYGSNLEYK